MRAISLVVTAVLLGVAAAASAETPTFFDDARLILDTRLRFEEVDQDSLAHEAHALTFRARAGFEAGALWQTRLLAEAERVWSLDGNYESTTNGNSDTRMLWLQIEYIW